MCHARTNYKSKNVVFQLHKRNYISLNLKNIVRRDTLIKLYKTIIIPDTQYSSETGILTKNVEQTKNESKRKR